VHNLHANGIEVLAGFIIGFDHDTLATFEQQRQFIMASGIQSAMIGLLHALPRTPLYERLQREGRLRDVGEDCDNTGAGTNIVPRQMNYDEMVLRYERLYQDLLTDDAIGERIRNKRRHMGVPLYGGAFSRWESLLITWRLLARGILPGGPRRWAAFIRSVPWLSVADIPWVLSDWIIGLSMADFARRRLSAPLASRSAERGSAIVRAALARYVDAGRAVLHFAKEPALAISLTMRGTLEPRFFRRAARALERLLALSPATLTLRVEVLRETEVPHFGRLLGRLRRYGDRVSIVCDERLRKLAQIDSSVFNLVLGGAGAGTPARLGPIGAPRAAALPFPTS
jgi:hypothetical protein